ncbi:MAG TPA: hypothetical protein VFZ25_07485 [Chloroflexota bacterium]|nr:hypothetical protein [Chloroflexota bacterium]
MATPQRQIVARSELLEKGNVLFFYRPIVGARHPRSSDQVERVYLALFPDDQSRHENRLIAFAEGVFPPVIPNEDLPEEREWAVVLETAADPVGVILAIEHVGPPESPRAPAPPLARLAGRGSYRIVRRQDRTYFAYALAEPKTLGPAQHMLLMESAASYQIRINEPYAPSGIQIPEHPTYPDALGEKFAGRMTVPADPTDYLDYQWTRLYVIAETTDLAGSLGIQPEATEENDAVRKARDFLADCTRQIQPTNPLEILKPMETGEIT